MTREVKISKLLKSVLVEIIDYYNPIKQKGSRGRPPKCSNKIYLDAIFYVLKEGIGWEYLRGYPVTGDAVRKKFKNWTDLGLFNLSWTIMLEIYKTFKLDFNDLFIDASHIKNSKGVDLTGSNHYDRFRKATKLSIITDDLGVPIGIHLDKSNKHDISLVHQTIESIPIDISNFEYLIGDKGYCSKDLKNQIADKYKIKLITVRKRKRNQKGKIRGRKPKNYHKTKDRFIVEHSFAWFKNYRRLSLRKDKQSINFKSFVYFGASCIIARKIERYIV